MYCIPYFNIFIHVENVDGPRTTIGGTSPSLDLLFVIRVPRAPQVSVGPRALLATRVPPLAV